MKKYMDEVFAINRRSEGDDMWDRRGRAYAWAEYIERCEAARDPVVWAKWEAEREEARRQADAARWEKISQ